ncbi:MAG: NAD(P)H-dependent glycerol-3-phosphate dehydrogenase [Pseudomonadota bacterium]
MIGVVGAGAFGTALACSLAQVGPVRLWGRGVRTWADPRTSPHLPDIAIPDAVTITDNAAKLAFAQALLLAVPMQQLDGVLSDLSLPRDVPLVACCKGIDLQTGRDAVQVAAAHGEQVAILTGPSFAHDIARGLPTALTLACADTALGKDLQARLSTPNLRLYTTTDTRGAALGGALKNVIAIACGVAMGAGLGTSARAAIMTRGFAEMSRFAIARGARAETLAGLSGFGDLALTCTSEGSRNYRFGLALGSGAPFDAAQTVEGAATAQALAGEADMPITQTVAALVRGDLDSKAAIASLMARPLKEE